MNQFGRGLLLSLALVVCVTAADAAAPNAGSLPDYNRLVDAVVAQYHLPGIAVGVIEDGKVVYTRAVGNLASGKPIDTDTLFQIASNSKSMTVTLLARLVEEGKLHWDDPVTKYLPSFQMYDPWVTAHMEVGDLLVHHSGLPEGAGDLMLWPEPNDFTPQDVVHGLRYLKPGTAFARVTAMTTRSTSWPVRSRPQPVARPIRRSYAGKCCSRSACAAVRSAPGIAPKWVT